VLAGGAEHERVGPVLVLPGNARCGPAGFDRVARHARPVVGEAFFFPIHCVRTHKRCRGADACCSCHSSIHSTVSCAVHYELFVNSPVKKITVY
jgi:hypothetical protein